MKITHHLRDSTPHNDAFQRSIKIGDSVIYNARSLNTDLRKAIVVGFSKQRVRVISLNYFSDMNRVETESQHKDLLDSSFCLSPGNIAVVDQPVLNSVISFFRGSHINADVLQA